LHKELELRSHIIFDRKTHLLRVTDFAGNAFEINHKCLKWFWEDLELRWKTCFEAIHWKN